MVDGDHWSGETEGIRCRFQQLGCLKSVPPRTEVSGQNLEALGLQCWTLVQLVWSPHFNLQQQIDVEQVTTLDKLHGSWQIATLRDCLSFKFYSTHEVVWSRQCAPLLQSRKSGAKCNLGHWIGHTLTQEPVSGLLCRSGARILSKKTCPNQETVECTSARN